MSEESNVVAAEEVLTTSIATPASEVPEVLSKEEEAAREESAALRADEAPVETPAEEAAEEAEEAEVSEEPESDEAEQAPEPQNWGDTGSDVGNNVLGYLQDAGVTTADAKAMLFDAAQAGDINLIDTAALEDKLGKHGANIILAGAKAFIAEGKEKVAHITETVHTAVGGEESWNKVRDWAADNVDADVLAEYRPMIDKGGAAARFAAQEIVGLYNADTKNSSIQTNNRAEATSVSPPASTAYNRAEYVKALDKAHKENAPQKVFDQIQAARNAGRKKGL